jgi:hypothetical protein
MFDGQDRFFRAALDFHGASGQGQSLGRFRRDHDHGLTDVQHFFLGQKRIIGDNQTEHVMATDIIGRVARNNTRDFKGGLIVDAQNVAAGDRTSDETNVQFACHRGKIVNEQCLSRDVPDRGIMGQRFAD